MFAVAFTGDSNSGKTTLIEKLSLLIDNKYPSKRVCIIKHDPKDKAQIDTPNKDSARFFESGADIAILGARQTTLRFHKPLEIQDIQTKLERCDYFFVEGLKELSLPRICIARNAFNPRFLPYISAIACDFSIPKETLTKYNLPILDLNNPLQILEWIHTHIKEM